MSARGGRLSTRASSARTSGRRLSPAAPRCPRRRRPFSSGRARSRTPASRRSASPATSDEDKQYRSSFFLIGGPVGLAVTGAASLAHNASKKAEAQRAAVPRWHQLGTAEVVVTNQRLIATGSGRTESLWYAEIGPLQLSPGRGGAPGVQFQPADRPLLRLEAPGAPLLYVFVHYLVDGQALRASRCPPDCSNAPGSRADSARTGAGNAPAIASARKRALSRRVPATARQLGGDRIASCHLALTALLQVVPGLTAGLRGSAMQPSSWPSSVSSGPGAAQARCRSTVLRVRMTVGW